MKGITRIKSYTEFQLVCEDGLSFTCTLEYQQGKGYTLSFFEALKVPVKNETEAHKLLFTLCFYNLQSETENEILKKAEYIREILTELYKGVEDESDRGRENPV